MRGFVSRHEPVGDMRGRIPILARFEVGDVQPYVWVQDEPCRRQ
jgi:hypothetical protein